MSPNQAGSWTYRSFHNNPQFVGEDPKNALALFFAEATMIFSAPAAPGDIQGVLDMGGGYFMDLVGKLQASNGGCPAVAAISGFGRDATPTAGWEYDYQGFIVPDWPHGIDQRPAFVGSVIRVKPHGSAKAGYTASFISVLQS